MSEHRRKLALVGFCWISFQTFFFFFFNEGLTAQKERILIYQAILQSVI